MRKNLLALSIAAMVGGLSGAANAAVIPTAAPVAAGATAITTTATALEINHNGIGHILAVPYFSTQGNNKTLLSITNTDTLNGKAVKLRFRGASNSDDIFDITVFMSPGDVWTADVANDGGISRLVTNDTSCTLPSAQDIKDLGGKFKTNRVQANDPAQTREGYVEILNTADIPVNTDAASLYTAIKHVNSKAPCTAAVMDAQSVDLTAATAGARGYANPTGGLMANWILVNVDGMASHSGEAVAVRAVDGAGANAAGNIVWFPQTTDAVTAGAVNTLTADPLLQSAAFANEVANYDFPDLSTPYFAAAIAGAPETQADTLATQLAVTSVANEYATSNGFSTDWVFSMPTRRYAVALNYAATGAARLVTRANGATANATGTFATRSAHFPRESVSLNAAGTLACVTPGNMKGYDREENTQSTFVISPDSAFKLCGETSVLAFNNTGASVLGGVLARTNITTKAADGWLTVNTAGVANNGLPIIGFSALKVNGSNLGGTWKHRAR